MKNRVVTCMCVVRWVRRVTGWRGGQSNHSKCILKYSIFDYDDDCEYNSDELRADFAFCDMLLDSFVPLTETSTI